MRQEARSSALEPNTFVASQVADFTNDKALFHKFLEEVSDRKILLQQSAEESFNLVQIMVKAGLQLMGDGESLDDIEHEPLFSRSLSAICFLLSENSEILVFQSQFEVLEENEQLWTWLFRTFSSLLTRKLPHSVTAAVDIAITTLLQGLQRDRLHAATFPQALQTVLQFTASLETHQTVPLQQHISDPDSRLLLQVRLYAIVMHVLCCRDDLESLSNTSKLLWGLFEHSATTLQNYTAWKSTSDLREVIDVGFTITAYACRASFSQPWLRLARQVLVSLITTFPNLPRNYSGLSSVLSMSLEKQVAFTKNIETIYNRLFKVRQILPSVVIEELHHVYDVLTREKSLNFSKHFTTTMTSFSSGNGSETQADPRVTMPVANIFKIRQWIDTPHPIIAELNRLVCPTDATTNISKLLDLIQQRFESFSKDVQVPVVTLMGLLVCATKGNMRQASHRDANKFEFACNVCQKQPHKSISTIAPELIVPGRMALDILLNFAKCQTVRDNIEVRIELVRAIRCSCKHLSAFETESLANTSLLKYINSGLEDASRQIRIFAGQILVDHFRYGQRQFEEDIYIQNRRRVFDMLRRHMTVTRLLESLIMTWADLGAVTRPDDLQLVLITLVDCLCNPNMFVRQTTIAAICRLANSLGCSTYMLFSPYMRHISAQVLDRSEKHSDFIITFSRILGISSADFLSRNQQYLLPLMILHGLQDHIESIAKCTKRSVKQAILDNIPYILSSLLTSGYNKDGGLMRFLAIAESSFQTVTLDELVNSYPIPLAVELLQLLADPVVKRESVMAALSQVAHICSKTHASTRKTPRDMALDNLKEFLHKHSLGIVSQCEESMNGYRGKKGLLDRVRYISAVAELILLIQHGIESAVPQITAFLQTAMNEIGLRLSALLAWDSLICVVTEEVAGPLIPYTICLFQSIWPLCNDQERGRIRSVLECILDDHQNILAKQIGQVPRIRVKELQDIEEKIAKFRPSTALTMRLKQLTQLTISDNPIICEEGLRELLSLLSLRQTEVYGVILKDWKDPSLHDTLRNLLDISYKFRGTHEDVQILAAECLGVIGAIDPVRQDASKKITREVILHNFEDVDAEESVKFVRIFLENQLVNAFQSATRSNVQIFLAWAIQELLKFSGFDESVIALTDHRGVTQNVEAKKRWRMFSPAAREVMIPLLSSKYDAGRRSTKSEVSYPIINHAKNYNSWLYLFLSDLLQSAVGQNAQKLFGVFSRILREEETVISNFLLPYVFLNVCVGCSIHKRDLLGLEIATILGPRPAADVFHAEFIRLARESVFLIIDYLSLWSRSRKIHNRDRLAEKMKRQNRHMLPEDENDKDQAVKIVQELTSQIPAKLMAEAALSCGAHSRALFYWEQHIRVQRADKKQTKEELEPLYAQLQQLYININDPDGIEGVSSCLTDMTLEQEIMMHENAGRWTSAQSSYELALRNTIPNDDLRIGVLNCLKQTGHHDVLMDQAIRYLQVTENRDSRIIDLAIESSWTLGQWKETTDLLHRAKHRSYDVLLGHSLLKYMEKDYDGYAQSILELKRKILNDLGLSNLDSTWQCYDSLAKLAVVYELECRVHTSEKPTKTLSPAILRDRLAIMPTTSPWKQHLLAVRRALLQSDSSITSARAISSTWLESAKLARKTGQSQQAYKAILNAMYCKDGTPLVKIEHARWWWKEGYQIRAIQTLQKALESKVFEGYEPDSHDSVLSLDASLLNSGKSPKAALISKAELLLTRWTDIAEHTNSKQQLKEYVNAARGSQLEKPHYFMGRYYLRLLEAENKKSPEVQDQDFLQGEYHRQVVMSYGRAMHFGVKYIFQTLPSYLQLWLDFGQEARTVHQKAATTNQKRQDLAGLRISRLAHMNEKIKGFVHRLPTYLYMLAFPQILSRINHSDKGCYVLLENMILKCLVDYPKQALWPFMAVCKSRDASRSTRGNTLIGRLRKEASKKENTNLSRLSLDAQNLTDQLMHLCTVPVIKNRASLSLTRDLDFNTNVAPSHLVVPIQNNLNVILPAHGGVGSTKHHRAFDEHQPTILSFKDEVDVMASLQKPRKVTIRGSDGELYPFLVKPNDDLRKDARLMDFNGVIQKFIRKDPEALKRLMKIRTYAVIALNEDHGLCEWVRNTRPLRDILVKTYAGRDISMQYAEVKTRLEQCLVAANPGQAFEVHVLKMFPPSFHDWFVEKFADPAQWFAARLSYSRTLAVMSMVGFVLGLGDRHGENILFDETTGDAVHVDFNCLFEKGHTFDKPERVPFRLTHNMVDALGVTGVEGAFRKTCEITLRILRTNQDAFNTVLESFLHDPVAEFLKKVKKSSNGEFEKAEAIKVLSVIANKLKGSAGTGAADKHTPLSIGGQADELIKQATDSKLLVQMYIGWTAWL